MNLATLRPPELRGCLAFGIALDKLTYVLLAALAPSAAAVFYSVRADLFTLLAMFGVLVWLYRPRWRLRGRYVHCALAVGYGIGCVGAAIAAMILAELVRETAPRNWQPWLALAMVVYEAAVFALLLYCLAHPPRRLRDRL